MPITYLKGDATSPQASGPKIIAHICNDIGKWGAGFVMAVSKKWPGTRAAYLDWANGRPNTVEHGAKFALGRVQYLRITSDHLDRPDIIAQAGIGTGSSGPPIRYEALDKCLAHVAKTATGLKASVHAPRIGCGLAGGKWDQVEPLIQKNLGEISVYIYDLG